MKISCGAAAKQTDWFYGTSLQQSDRRLAQETSAGRDPWCSGERVHGYPVVFWALPGVHHQTPVRGFSALLRHLLHLGIADDCNSTTRCQVEI